MTTSLPYFSLFCSHLVLFIPFPIKLVLIVRQSNTKTTFDFSSDIDPSLSQTRQLMRHLSRFSTWRICSREQRKKQLDWLATNTDDITSQSHSLFTCSREQIRQVENRLKSIDYLVCRLFVCIFIYLTFSAIGWN